MGTHRCDRFGTRLIVLALILISVALTSAGCRPKKKPAINFAQELAPGQKALRKIPIEEYPEFALDASTLPQLRQAIDHSLAYLNKASSKEFYPYLDITHERAVATLKGMAQLIDDEISAGSYDGGARINRAIRERFDVYKSFGAPDPEGGGFTDSVKFTAYCTPIYEASQTQTGPYQFPLYKRPADLMTDPTGKMASRKTPEGKFVPYYTRRQIEGENVLKGQEVVWLKSRWEAYVISVQGSARLRMPDGRTMEIGYAGNNGYDYPTPSPADQMLSDGVITREQRNLKGMSEYFRAHPETMEKYLWSNNRYIFFADRPGGPFGSLNEPVTPMATIATDKEVYPRAMPAFLMVAIPVDTSGGMRDYRGFMLDQDTGGAIRASGRCDIYMGIGPQAEAMAGQEQNIGQLYYIAIKPEYAK